MYFSGVEDDRALDESQWRGQNLLGKALMEVRKKLIEDGNGSLESYLEDYS